MEEIRDRLGLIAAVGEHKISTSVQVFDIELAFLQLRKSLELIAFASLIANKDKYSAAYANFASQLRIGGRRPCLTASTN